MDSNISEEFCYYGRNILCLCAFRLLTLPFCISTSVTGNFLTLAECHTYFTEKRKQSCHLLSKAIRLRILCSLKSQHCDNTEGFSDVCFVLNESLIALLESNSWHFKVIRKANIYGTNKIRMCFNFM